VSELTIYASLSAFALGAILGAIVKILVTRRRAPGRHQPPQSRE
jgi:hypothetical protein